MRADKITKISDRVKLNEIYRRMKILELVESDGTSCPTRGVVYLMLDTFFSKMDYHLVNLSYHGLDVNNMDENLYSFYYDRARFIMDKLGVAKAGEL